ncbi:hypothetical protein ACFLQ5_00590 [Bacteroidota bacterium]
MKKTLILSIICFLGFGFFAQTTLKAQENEIATLEQANENLKKQLWILKQELKVTNTNQEAKLDSLLDVVNYTQYVVNKQSDSLETTGEKLIDLEEDTESHKDSVSDYIFKNSISMGVIFLIIIAFNIIIFIVLRNRLNANYSHTENKFNEAFIDFDDNIKAASSMLNKHIKEVKESLDKQITTTNSTLDKQLKSISDSIEKKTSENKAFFDEHALKTKEEFAKEIKSAKDNFKKKIKKTEDVFDEKLTDHCKTIDNKIEENKKDLDKYFKEKTK